jgi:hypothetical protein
MNIRRPIASLSLDLDNQWSYMKVHGDDGWRQFPSYFDIAVPRILQFLRTRNLTITFFIVGQDAALDRNRDALAAIAEAGHEIANHSFHHDSWLHLYSESQVTAELAKTEEHLERVTGRRPTGFRGPGYSLSPTVIEVLASRGYRYDASTLPTVIGPLARWYYFRTAKLDPEERRKRAALFGSFRDALRPLKPYLWKLRASELVEIPVTTMPVFRTPIHASYLLYIRGYSPSLALAYFRTALNLCRWTGVQPSLLLHPLDFLGHEDVNALEFFPAMSSPSHHKLDLLDAVLGTVQQNFQVVTMEEHARSCRESGRLRTVDPATVSAGSRTNR